MRGGKLASFKVLAPFSSSIKSQSEFLPVFFRELVIKPECCPIIGSNGVLSPAPLGKKKPSFCFWSPEQEKNGELNLVWERTSTFINGDKTTATPGRIRGGNFLLRSEELLSTKQLHSEAKMPRGRRDGDGRFDI